MNLVEFYKMRVRRECLLGVQTSWAASVFTGAIIAGLIHFEFTLDHAVAAGIFIGPLLSIGIHIGLARMYLKDLPDEN